MFQGTKASPLVGGPKVRIGRRNAQLKTLLDFLPCQNLVITWL